MLGVRQCKKDQSTTFKITCLVIETLTLKHMMDMWLVITKYDVLLHLEGILKWYLFGSSITTTN